MSICLSNHLKFNDESLYKTRTSIDYRFSTSINASTYSDMTIVNLFECLEKLLSNLNSTKLLKIVV